MAVQSWLSSTLVTSSIATAATTVAALLFAKRETGSAPAALNATSHIVWGDDAARHDELDWQHTALGGLLNAGAMGAWAGVQHALFPKPRSLLGAAGVGAAVSALAYVTDYWVVPKRLTPGFEKRLSKPALLGIYAALATALAVGARLRRKR